MKYLGSINLVSIFSTKIFGAGYRPNFLYAVDENSCAAFANPGASNIFASMVHIFVVDKSGAYTWYVINKNVSIKSIIPYGGGRFNIVFQDATIYYAQLANKKLNNSTPINISTGSNPFTISCPDIVSPSTRLYIDANTGQFSAGLYSANGQFGGQVYSFYGSVNKNGGINIENSGVCGTWSSDPPFDPFDKTNGTANYNGQSNGLFTNFQKIDNQISISSLGIGINPGVNAGCNTSDGVTGTYVFPRFFETIATGVNQSTAYKFVDSTITGFLGILWEGSGGYPYDWYLTGYSGNFSAYCALPSYNIFGYLNCALVTDSTLFFGGSNTANDWTVFGVPNPGFLPGTNIAFNNTQLLVNSARPISLTGAYKS